jgi:methionyl-tRNA formyltransferase
MRVLFWGTPAYAVPSIDALVAAGHQLLGVVSQPDRRRGRGKALQPSPVKARALELGLPVFTPERIRHDTACQQQLAALQAEVSVVVAYGQILPPAVLEQPPLGCWNGHGSLLPRWRGAAPIQWSLIEGDSHTGVGIMAMEEGLDTGPVLLERSVAISLLDNAQTLGQRLSALTAALLVEALPRLAAAGPGPLDQRLERLQVKHQSNEGLTYARLLHKQDYRINWASPALAIHRRVMGLYPGASTSWRGQQLNVLASEPLVSRLADQLSAEVQPLLARWGGVQAEAPGTVLASEAGLGLVVATAGCPLLIRQAQLQGKSPTTGNSLIQQLAARPGEQLGAAATASTPLQ